MDPLELLSDNSLENDSFFENPTGITNKSKTTSKLKGGTDDLFGIKEESEFDFEYKGVGTGTNAGGGAKSTTTPRIVKQKPSQSHDSNNDDDDDLGFDPKKPKAGSKASIFDDILTNIDTKRPATTTNALPSTSTTSRPTVSRQSTDTTTDNSNWAAMQVTRPKTSFGGRRSSNTITANADPLGLWIGGKERDSNISSSVLSTPKAKPSTTNTPNTTAATANWLGLSIEPNEKKVAEQRANTPPRTTNKPTIPRKEHVDILEIPHRPADHEETTSFEAAHPAYDTTSQDVQDNVIALNATTQNMITLNALNMQTSNAAITALHQQESQLSLAAQMRRQEQALVEMKLKQDVMLQQQERNFANLLQEQVQRQQQMEQHIVQQQKRINAHIQLMMAQQPPPSIVHRSAQHVPNAAADVNDVVDTPTRTVYSGSVKDNVQVEVDIKHLQLEKAQLETFVESLKANYENEIELIERSYRKQLKVLNDHQEAVEMRLKTELTAQITNYEQKLRSMQDERDNMKARCDEDIALLKQTHDEELRKLKRSHDEDFDILKEDHRRMLDNVRQAKLLEFAAVQDNVAYLDTLRSASNNLEHLSDNLHGLRDELQLKMETLNRERESKLAVRECRVADAEKRVQINADAAENEKRRLMELVSSLELQLGKLSQETADDNWLLREKMTMLEAEKSALEREKEFHRGQLAREEKRLAEQKELQSRETQRMLDELQAERARLLTERIEFETKQKLQVNSNFDDQRLEVEAALKVAQDATQQADVERKRYHRAQRDVEQAKRQLVDKQNAMRAREKELEEELCTLHVQERKSQEAHERTKQSEHNFQQKLQILQQRMRELAEKEASVSQERMLLAHERIKLHDLRVKLSERKCALCQMTERNEEITQLLANTTATNKDVMVVGVDAPLPALNAANVEVQPNFIERLLDENISESLRKMHRINATDLWSDSALDDDSKELALHHLDAELQQNNYNNHNKSKTKRK